MIDLVFAHPYPNRSRANRTLLAAVRDVPGVEVRSLYDLYPDFGIDIEAEQAALARAQIVVFQHPLYWYSVPGLLKHWFDKVLAHGWAYGEGGNALEGKACFWVASTGGDDNAFSKSGMHAHPFASFVAPIEQTARFCKMQWEPPFLLHGAHRISDQALSEQAQRYRDRLLTLSARFAQDSTHG
jgi:glutathione-regulated potassium-efflux system ancillary protein KefF